MNTNGKIDNRGGDLSPDIKRLDRLVEISCITRALREFRLSVLNDEEREHFLQMQGFFIRLEASCYDAAGFI